MILLNFNNTIITVRSRESDVDIKPMSDEDYEFSLTIIDLIVENIWQLLNFNNTIITLRSHESDKDIKPMRDDDDEFSVTYEDIIFNSYHKTIILP